MSHPDVFDQLSACRLALDHWAREVSLPLWAAVGVDLEWGGFHELLDPDARPVHMPRRTRVVARQIYVFAVAWRRGWLPNAANLVEHGARFLMARLQLSAGTFARSIDLASGFVDQRIDLYEQAFALFGLAHAYEVTGRSEFVSAARRLLAVLKSTFWQPKGGFAVLTADGCVLKANPHMHLLEAALWWGKLEGEECGWRTLAADLVSLCRMRFVDPLTGAVSENFDRDWLPLDEGHEPPVEPGHQYEWAWLLLQWGQRTGTADVYPFALRLIEIGEEFGVDRDRNVVVNGLNRNLVVVDGSARLWPQTERLKVLALLVSCQHSSGELNFPHGLVAASAGLKQYLDVPKAGLWTESFDVHGVPGFSEVRASSLYHIICCIDVVCSAVESSMV